MNDDLREKILDLVKIYDARFSGTFVPGETYIPNSGKYITSSEVLAMVNLALDRNFNSDTTLGNQFSRAITDYFHGLIRKTSLCNSGSGANLLAITAITDKQFGSRAAAPGDEIITVSAGFPTTVNPIIQNGLIPVFVDVDLNTFTPNPDVIEEAITEKTKGIILAHPLGNPFDAVAIRDICDEYNLWLIEDSCDALGGTLDDKPLGSFGDLSTLSFYPAHQITTAEGGAVMARSPMVSKIVESYRDWGRDCWCMPGMDNTCGKRFGWRLGELPEGYDHKFIYSRIGYNLKMTEMQAALGIEQMKKLDFFTQKRRHNFERLYNGMKKFDSYFRFVKTIPTANPAWFGFPITVKDYCSPFTKFDIVTYLDNHKIGSRQLFGGNLIKQPAYQGVEYRISGELSNSDIIMKNTFWIGVHPGITDEMIDYILEVFENFMAERC